MIMKYLNILGQKKISECLQLANILVLLLLITIMQFHIFGQDEDHYTVVGRVVDENGKPIGDSGIWLVPARYNTTTFYKFDNGFGTDSNGKFLINILKSRLTIRQDFLLFVSVDRTQETLTTVSPPFVWIREHDKSFDGKLIKFGGSKHIDVGDLKVQFWYDLANLDFSQYKKKKKLSAIDWYQLYLRIRNKDGFRVYESSLSEDDVNVNNYIDKAKSILKISLPEGRWKIEAIWFGKVLGESSYFVIKRDEKPVTVKIKPKLKPR